MQSIIDAEFQQESCNLLGGIVSFFERLGIENEMPLEFQENLTFYDLFKAAKVQIKNDYESLTEKVITYLTALQNFTLIRIIVFVNVRCYFTDEQFKEILKHISYLSLSVICLESVQPVRVANEKMFIVDKDFCEIIVDD